jgi:uncharacterized protein YciI
MEPAWTIAGRIEIRDPERQGLIRQSQRWSRPNRSSPTDPPQRMVDLSQVARVCSTTRVKRWIYLIRPVRLAMTEDPTEHEAAILRAHFARLEELCEQGTVLLAGPSLAGADTFGLVVLDLEQEADARAIMEADPAIVGGLMTGELRPFRMSLSRLQRG